MPDPERTRLLKALAALGRYFTQSNIREAMHVSLLIEGRFDPGTRKELRQRVAGLLDAQLERLMAEDGPADMRDQSETRYRAEVRSLYHAMTDSNPTDDELNEMAGKKVEAKPE